MNREIKFRGKRLDNGEWVCGYYAEFVNYLDGDTKPGIQIIRQVPSTIDRMTPAFETELCEVDPDTVGQYTGLKDKNGAEVYEEDICRDGNGKIGVVKVFGGTRKMPNGFGGFEQFGLYTKCDDGGWQHFEKTSFIGFEVLGNIFENKDLLDKGDAE